MQVTARNPASILIPAVCAALALAAPLGAQRVDGRVLDSQSREPVPLVTIALLDTTMTVVDETFTNERGEFTLSTPRAGAFYLLAQRMGYARKLDGILELGAGGSIRIDFYLKPDAVRGDSLTVEARRERTLEHLEAAGFYDRLRQRSAWFQTPEDLERRSASSTVQLLRSAPGARVMQQGAAASIAFRGGSVMPLSGRGATGATFGARPEDPAGYCTPRVIIDGIEVPAVVSGIPGAVLDGIVDVRSLVGVEVHTGSSSLPLEYAGTTTSCATILLWTARGAGR